MTFDRSTKGGKRNAARLTIRAVLAAILASTAGVLVTAAPGAEAAGTTLFSQPFHDNTVDGPAGSVSLPAAPTGINAACLSAAGNATANPLASCPTSTDAQGSGKLRFTSATQSQEGGVFAGTSVPTSQGLDVKFNLYQYGGNGADGTAFVLAAVDPANPKTPSTIGQSGGALGYSANTLVTPAKIGLADGYLGIGFDTYGNFSNKYEGTGCVDPSNIAQQMPGQVVVRGPGNGTVGYCALQSSAATATSGALSLRSNNGRTASLVPAEIVFNPGSSSVTTASGLVVPGGDYDVTFTPVGGTARSLVGPLPTVPSGLYPSSWLTSANLPKQLAFGWVASTGNSTDFHEIDSVVVTSINPVPQLAVSQTSYSPSTPVVGGSVTYTVSASSSSGATESNPVTVTETLPSGVVPVGASGTGWTCAAPVGQQISCTSTSSPFSSGSLTINAIVKSSGVTQSTIQTASTVLASSSDGNPATSSSAPGGTLPSPPSVTGVSPTNGAAGGGNDVTVSGSGLSGATAIEIGTTGDFSSGAPTTLVKCASSGPGCFTVTSDTSLDISSMPAHAAGAVTVRVVTLGVSGSASYTYNTGPALLFGAPPGGEVNVAYTDQLTVTGGTSPFTWSISSGSLPPGITLNSSTGLLSGTPTSSGTFSFTVKVTDHAGLSDTAATSITIIPAPSLSFPAPPGGWTHTVYLDTLTESGGTSPFTWSLASGSLPPGISLTSSGNLSGTATATGTYSFTVKVTDANGQSATQATSLTISTGVTANFSPPPAAAVNVPYSDTLTATGGTTPYTWSVNAGTLPPGITLSAGGVLSGTPTATGSYSFSVNVIDANNGVSTASVTLVVTTSSLTITSTASTGTVSPGGTVSYTITATNSGQVAYTGATFTDSLSGVLDDATYNSNAAASSGTVSFTSPNLTWTGNLAVGATATITFTVTVKNPDPGDKLMTATVTSTTAGANCAAGNSDSRCASSVSVLVPGLTITASADNATTTPGAAVHYTVTVTNSGQTSYTGATFADPLPGVLDDATYNADAAATAGTVSFSSPNLTWTGNLAAGAAATITFSVTVKNPDTGNDTLTSTITSTTTGSNCASGSTDTRCTATVNVAVLTITNTANVGNTTPGGIVRFTAVFTNTGQVPYDGITIATDASDVFDDATPNGDDTATSGNLTITGTGVSWTGDIPVGGSVTVTGTVTVNNPDTGNKLLASTITTTAAGSNCPAGTTDPNCSVSVPVLVPALTITQTANAPAAVPGQTVTITVTVANTGQTPYTGTSVTDTFAPSFDDAAYNNDAAATTGSASVASGVLTWTGNLNPGASAVITYSLTVNNPDTGDKLLISKLTSPAAGSTCPADGSNPACQLTVPVLTPGLDIAMTSSPSPASPGQVVTYSVKITDTGQTAYTNTTTRIGLAGALDDAFYNNNAAATTGTVAFSSPNLTWTGSLTPGTSATVTFTVTVANPDLGDRSLVVTALTPAQGGACAAGSTDPACTNTIPVVNATTLAFTNAAGVSSTTAGGVVHYTITAANSGLIPYIGAAVTESLAGITDDATYNNDIAATAGTATITSGTLTWNGTVPATGSVTITFSVTVKNPDTGNGVLAATLSSASIGSNCGTGSSDPRCATGVTVSSLLITNTSNVTSTTPGSVVRFTAVFTNTGQTPYDGITIATNASNVFDDATPNGDQTATSGTITITGTGVTWIGDIPAGGTVTVTGTVTVNNPDTGNKLLASTITTTAAGSNCPSGTTDPQCSVSVPVLVPGLTLTQNADTPAAVPGQKVTYTLTITNTGQTTYTGATVTDTFAQSFDDAAYDNDAAATTGSATVTNGILTWTGNLTPGASAVITYSLTVTNPDTGDKVLVSVLNSTATGATCPATGNTCQLSVPVLTPALDITTAPSPGTATNGGTQTYTVTITDSGQTPYPGLSVTTGLAGALDDAAYNNNAATTAGTVSYASPSLTWTGNLVPGGSATVTFTMTVDNPDTSDHILTVTTTTTAQGSECNPSSPDPACTTSTPVAELDITNTADATTATPGTSVGYTIRVTNAGQTTYTATTITDDLADTLDDSTFSNDAATTAGSVTFSSPTLTWTGTLTPGQTAVITFTMTVIIPVTGTGNQTMNSTTTTTAPGSTCPAASPAPACTATVTVIPGALTMTVPATANLGSGTPGTTITGNLGTVQVTDNRGLGQSWTATVSSTAFTTGPGGTGQSIPASNLNYSITALAQTTGPATFSFTPSVTLSGTPQSVVTATNVNGDTTATWNPLIAVSVPLQAVGGTYTGTITESVS